MKDFTATVEGISGLARYYKMEEGQYSAMTDYGPYAKAGTYKGYPSSGSGVQEFSQQNGYLLDQTRKTYSFGLGGGHGYSTYGRFNLNQAGGSPAPDNPNGVSFSLVLAGLKPHDMSVARGWHGILANNSPTVSGGMDVIINADGSVHVSAAGGTLASSAAGVITRFLPHLLIVSYDHVAGAITVYCGDWTGRWATVINAVTLASISGYTSSYLYAGYSSSSVSYADGFLDDLAVYVGHAITSSEATLLQFQAGYQGAGLSYPPTLGHRNAPLNQAYPASTPLTSNTAASGVEMGLIDSQSYVAGAGGFDYYSFSSAIYPVTASFRNNPTNLVPGLMNGPSVYDDICAEMQFEDCPCPYNGRPSLGFQPSLGTDYHLTVYCAQTDEVWDASGSMTNVGTDAAPDWNFRYGGKVTQMSLLMTTFASPYLGTTAIGAPCIMGVPRIVDIFAAMAGTPLKQGLAFVSPTSYYYVWPANRHDGGAASSYPLQQGNIVKLPNTTAVSALIAAMPHPTGRVIAQALQTYGLIVLDSNNWGGLVNLEEEYQFTTVNGYNPYLQDAGGVLANGILNGQAYPYQTLANLPWSSLQVLDPNMINPSYNGQPLLPAPTIAGFVSAGGTTRIMWQDQAMASTYQVYRKSGSTYTLVATSQFPEYTLPIADAPGQQYVVTSKNGGGESLYSLPITPTSTVTINDLSITNDSTFVPIPTPRAAIKRKLHAAIG